MHYCPECGAKYKKSYGYTCECGYAYVFDPTRDKLTDGRLRYLLDKVSAGNTNYFTRNQLFAAYMRTLNQGKSNPLIWIVLTVLFLALGGAATAYGEALPENVHLIMFGVAGGMALLVLNSLRREKGTEDVLNTALSEWIVSKGKLERLLLKNAFEDNPPSDAVKAMFRISVRRILVVERPQLADLLILNGFHAQERTLVLSLEGYPAFLIPAAKSLLARKKDLPVFMLHDASYSAMSFNKSKLPFDCENFMDLGVFPDDMKKIKDLKKLGLHKHNFQASVDVLPNSFLIGALAEAMEEEKPLSEVIQGKGLGHYDSGDTDGLG